jgi:pimeloyl-ACP methyl ester carboxylesterase
MTTPRTFLAFACAHLTDERLYAAQVEALGPTHDCRVFAFREHDSLGAMAEELLANTPERFTLVGLSLGGYLAFEVIRRQLRRLERLVLMDTTAVADAPARRAGRLADLAKVRDGGIEALIPELPSRWLLPAHVHRADLVGLMADMARSIGPNGQRNQQAAMLARPDSHTDLAKVRVPTLVMCGREDPVTPVTDHEAMARCVPGSRLELIESCGHLSTIEQPQAVNRVLVDWLQSTSPEGR